MNVRTASEVISLAKELETVGVEFYHKATTAYPQYSSEFEKYTLENAKFIKQIERSYYSVISDAIEGAFAFDLDPEPYRIRELESDNLNSKGFLQEALSLERQMVDFYNEAAEQSMSLMADVPRTFKLVAKKHSKRIETIEGML